MPSEQWIQHASKTGPKYDAKHYTENGVHTWLAYVTEKRYSYYFPYDQYVPCDPPERWVDVTGQCEIFNDFIIQHTGQLTWGARYRRRLKQDPFPHIIVERKEVD